MQAILRAKQHESSSGYTLGTVQTQEACIAVHGQLATQAHL